MKVHFKKQTNKIKRTSYNAYGKKQSGAQLEMMPQQLEVTWESTQRMNSKVEAIKIDPPLWFREEKINIRNDDESSKYPMSKSVPTITDSHKFKVMRTWDKNVRGNLMGMFSLAPPRGSGNQLMDYPWVSNTPAANLLGSILYKYHIFHKSHTSLWFYDLTVLQIIYRRAMKWSDVNHFTPGEIHMWIFVYHFSIVKQDHDFKGCRLHPQSFCLFNIIWFTFKSWQSKATAHHRQRCIPPSLKSWLKTKYVEVWQKKNNKIL